MAAWPPRLGDLAPLERYNLVSDTWAATLSGHAPLADLLALARALVDSAEGDPSVWSVVLGALGLFDRMVPDDERPVLALAVRTLLGPLAARPGLGPPRRRRRADPVPPCRRCCAPSGTIGADPDIQAEAARRLRRGRATVPLHADTESALLDIVAADGGVDEYEAFLAALPVAGQPAGGDPLPVRPGRVRRCGLAARTFDLALTEVRTQNAPFLFRQLLVANRVTGPAAWQRITEALGRSRWPVPRPTSCPACSTGSGACARRPSWPTGHRLRRGPPPPRRGKTVEQILERLAVNVGFGQRAGCHADRRAWPRC